MTGQMSKADGRRSSRHESHYANNRPRLAKRKDRNVRRSSRGTFETVAELTAHQTKVSKPIPHKKREKLVVSDHWTSRDTGRRDDFTSEYLRSHAFNPAHSRIM